jgi:hypothetical protein
VEKKKSNYSGMNLSFNLAAYSVTRHEEEEDSFGEII